MPLRILTEDTAFVNLRRNGDDSSTSATTSFLPGADHPASQGIYSYTVTLRFPGFR